jgi:hypothetical protein
MALASLWLVLAYRTHCKKEPIMSSIVVVIAGVALWLLPGLSASGGFSELMRLMIRGPVGSEVCIDRLALLLESGKAFVFGCLLFCVALFFLLKKAGNAYRGRLVRHSIFLTMPILFLFLLQVALGRTPSALIIIPVPLIIFCASVGALLFEPETSMSGRKRYVILGLMMALPGLVFLLMGGDSDAGKDGFRAEQWTLRSLKNKQNYSANFKTYTERFATSGSDSSIVVVASLGVLNARDIAYLLYPVEVYDMHQLSEQERAIMTYYHKHRRFLLTDSEIELKNRTCFFIGKEGVFRGDLPVNHRYELQDGRIISVIKSATAEKLVFRSQSWILE